MIPWLDKTTRSDFPDIDTALHEPDGLLAAGGDLSAERLLSAYYHGIFPWYSPGEPILWWSPSQRMVIYEQKIHISRSMQRFLQKSPFEMRIDSAFADVIDACAAPRQGSSGTWIDDDMTQAYINLYNLGYAHSIECWQNNDLVGGMYGVQLGHIYFGESMFSKVTNASKAALIYTLQNLDIALIDCQFYTDHLASMGGELISREQFLAEVKNLSDIQSKSNHS